MAYLTREDGERFVIPSYRDILSAKKTSLIKREVLLLSQNYGNYVAIQKKSLNEYEVAFSPDPGYLLGECVWYYFKRPYDMIYCEALPNTNEAILVIVKGGAVYLDGSFPLDSIAEELVVFKTQQNNFEIYVYGDVPLSRDPEEGKFNFDANSIKSFIELPTPLFPTLPAVKAFQVLLVDQALAAYGIGVLPIKQIGIGVLSLLGLFLIYKFLTMQVKEIKIITFTAIVNPLQAYFDQMTTPDPSKELISLATNIGNLFTMPGWRPESIDYIPGNPAKLNITAKSGGARTYILNSWAAKNNALIQVTQSGLSLSMVMLNTKREMPTTIYRLDDIIMSMVDRLSYVFPGNVMGIGAVTDRKEYKEANIVITVNDITLDKLVMLADILKDLPLSLQKVSFKVSTGKVSGTISLKALGN